METMQDNDTAAPLIWEYRDARAYTQDLCDWKQAHETGFSFRKLTRLAGLASPGYIRTYLQGKRNLKPETATALGTALGLGHGALAFFEILVAFTQSDNDDDRLKYLEQMLQRSIAHGSGTIDAARLGYFTEWYVPVVHAMASLAGFVPDADWIAPRLVPAIPRKEAQRALQVLQELGIFDTDENGAFVVREKLVETHEKVRGLWVREYHRGMIRLAGRAIDLLPRDERLMNGLTLTVPGDMAEEVRTWAHEMMRDLFYRIMAAQQDRKVQGDIMQLNLQLFRLSDIALVRNNETNNP